VNLKLDLGTLNRLLKAVILLAFAWLIWHVSQDQKTLSVLSAELREQILLGNKLLVAAVIALMPVNWLLESMKWRALNRPIHQISLTRALKAVLMGLTISIFTPARIGEYLGRIINIRPRDKWKALAAQLIGSMMQLVLLMLAGLWGLSIIARESAGQNMPDQRALLAVAGIILLLLLMLLRAPRILHWIRVKLSMPRLRDLMQQMHFISNYSGQSMTVIASITLLRLAIYVFQYWLLLQFFGLEIRAPLAVAAILATYLIQSGLPLPLLLGLFARGEVTLLVWKFFPVNELTLLSASYALWVINVFLPALIGLGFLLKTDFLKSFGFEKK